MPDMEKPPVVVAQDDKGTVVELTRTMGEIKAGIESLNGTIRKLETDKTSIEERLARQEEFSQRNMRDNPDGNGGIRKINLGEFIRGMIAVNTGAKWPKGADYEREVFEKSAQTREELGYVSPGDCITWGGERVMTSTPVGAGGGFVAAQYLNDKLIEPLLPSLIFRKMGAQVWGGLTGSPVQVPRIVTQSVPTAVLEGGVKPDSQPVEQLPTMVPHEIGVYCELSRWLDILAQRDMGTFIGQQLISAVLQLQDNFCFNGTGGAGQPQGLIPELLAAPSLYAMLLDGAGNGSLLSPEDIDNCITQQEGNNGTKMKLGWAMSPRTGNRIVNMRGGPAGALVGFMFPESRLRATDGVRDIAGLPFMTSTVIPNNMVEGASGAVCSFAIYGDWNTQIIGEWGGLDFAMSEHFQFQRNRKAFRCSMLFDRMTTQILSMVGIQGIL